MFFWCADTSESPDMSVPKPSPWRSRLLLVALAALFSGGAVLAYVLVASGWRPTHTRNYGALVEPARPLVEIEFNTLAGGTARLGGHVGTWSLVYFGAAECLSPCINNLYKMRQIVAAQGKEAARVRRVFVVTDGTALDMLRYTLKDYPGMELLIGPASAMRSIAPQFDAAGVGVFDGVHRLYVVDPLGNLMMSYPADADPRRMVKDLSLLLRASRIG